jgi:hypothetical protein
MDNKIGAGEPSRPIILYVSGVQPAKLNPTHTDTVTAMDIELSAETAAELVKMLSGRLQDAVPGAIRVRLLGHLVIG